ncbi:MAG: chemotaxis protein CheR [Spirochaetaceae bacterium]|nr:MAG: chemotaxis protein CheR [Spirochaetaceae bacterium]
MSDLVDITDAEFERIQSTVYHRFGIDLSKKRTLIRGRLNGTLRKLGYRSFGDYLEAVDTDETGARLTEMIDILSTNHTFFFREADHLDYLVTAALPAIYGGAVDLSETRVWCAGCSTGEEPYSILIALADAFGMKALPAHPLILASDISTRVLATAKAGVYPVSRTREAGDIVKRGYARQLDSERIEMSQEMRRRLLFRRINLMDAEFPFRHQFNVIFCRNVMIYFDVPTRVRLVAAFRRHLRIGGFLFLGHSESMGRNVAGFQYLQPAVYRRTE